MRKNKVAEAIFSKYSDPKSTPSDPQSRNHYTKKGGTLSDFYREVHTANSQKMHPYLNKNATEIESMMMNNRRLIESARAHTR